jgi:hypothetical protein
VIVLTSAGRRDTSSLSSVSNPSGTLFRTSSGTTRLSVSSPPDVAKSTTGLTRSKEMHNTHDT